MKAYFHSTHFPLLLLVVAVILGSSLASGCATWRGVQTDVHRVTNPQWSGR